MKTVINNLTGDVLYHTNIYNIELGENERLVDFIPETITEKPQSEEELNRLQYTELKSTDWYYIRKIDTGEEVPEEIIIQRNLIRQKYNNLKI